MTSPNSEPFLTRQQAADYIRDELGRPMSFSTLTKLCALGEGPEPAAWWGRRPLYSRDGLRAWADARTTTVRHALQLSRNQQADSPALDTPATQR
jgi:hypothetical protein